MKTKLKVAISTVSGYFQEVQLAANTSIPSLPSYSMHTTSRSHASAWECCGQRARVAGNGRWRVGTRRNLLLTQPPQLGKEGS